MSAANETRQVCREIDRKFTATLQEHGMAFSLKKIRGVWGWTVEVGKFDHAGDPFIRGEISPAFGDVAEQFKEILDQAIADKEVNYTVKPKMEEPA